MSKKSKSSYDDQQKESSEINPEQNNNEEVNSYDSHIQNLYDRVDRLEVVISLLARNTGWSGILREQGIKVPEVKTKNKYDAKP